MKRLTPHQKIIRAAMRETGLRLTAEEIHYLAIDDAIQTMAANDDDSMAAGRTLEQVINERLGLDPLPAGFTEAAP